MSAVLQVEGVHKAFAGLPVLAEFDLTLRRGDLFALIGPNGSGKSTVIELICGTEQPDAGRIRLAGKDMGGVPPWRRAHLGVGRCHQDSRLWNDLTAAEHLITVAEAMPGRSGRPSAAELAELVQLPYSVLRLTPDCMTLLQRRRLELALAASVASELLLLDELGAGLAAREAHLLYDCAASWIQQGHVGAVIMVEHRLELVFERATAVGLLRKGHLTQASRENRSEFEQVMAGLFRHPRQFAKEFA